MMASARGIASVPGKNVKAKRKLNESLAEAAIEQVGKPLYEGRRENVPVGRLDR